jgi:hypothetical protein
MAVTGTPDVDRECRRTQIDHCAHEMLLSTIKRSRKPPVQRELHRQEKSQPASSAREYVTTEGGTFQPASRCPCSHIARL